MKRGKATSSCCVVSSLVLLLARLVSRTHAESKVFDMTRIARLPCPEGTEWATVWESFYMNQNFHEKWKFDAGPETSSGFDTEVRDGDIIGLGLRMNVSAGIGKNDTAFVSKYEWMAPVTVQVNIKSTGAPGIPSTFNFRRNGVTGWKEMDFIIASHQAQGAGLKHFISMPLYKPVGTKLKLLNLLGTDREISMNIEEPATAFTFQGKKFQPVDGQAQSATFQRNWAVSWEDFNPSEDFNTYAIEWLPNKINWHAGPRGKPTLRVTIYKEDKEHDSFPKGPLPLRFGPWESKGDWAGVVDWSNYPDPKMYIQGLNITGCRLK